MDTNPAESRPDDENGYTLEIVRDAGARETQFQAVLGALLDGTVGTSTVLQLALDDGRRLEGTRVAHTSDRITLTGVGDGPFVHVDRAAVVGACL